MSNSKADKFCLLFHEFQLVVRPLCEARSKASPEDLKDVEEHKTAAYLKSMLKKANEEYNHAKKLFKHGKITKDELYDYEWRVFEIKDQLDKLDEQDGLMR